MGKKGIKRWKNKAHKYLLENGPCTAEHLLSAIYFRFMPTGVQQITQQFLRDPRFRHQETTKGSFHSGTHHYKVLEWVAVEVSEDES